MPAYPWLFEEVETVGGYDKELNVPEPFRAGRRGHIVPGEKVRQLVAYLLLLKQVDLPDGSAPAFIEYRKSVPKEPGTGGVDGLVQTSALDGAALYTQHCQACHQANGEGLAGAFPPLKGSPVVNDANAELMVRIMLQGYDARAEYAVMPPFAEKLSDDEIAAIATHERSTWGNKADRVTPDFVKKLRATIKTETTQ